MTIKTDRSRIAAYRNCPRLRYWQYEHQGMGLEPVAQGLPLAFGIHLHDAFARLLQGEAPETVIGEAVEALETTWGERGLTDGAHKVPSFFMAEQRWLLAGLCWAWLHHRYHRLRDLYEALAIEHELQWEMAPGLIDMIRVDALVRRRDDQALFYLEWKTVSNPSDEWLKGWSHNSQFLANVLALEETLHVRIDGVLVEGIVKGRRVVEKAKTSPYYQQRVQDSPICYGWEKAGLTWDYQPGAAKRPLYEIPGFDLRAWVAGLPMEKLFAPVPALMPRRDHLERWRRQAVIQERRISQAIQSDPIPLDVVFPLNDDHCFRYWGHPCAFEPLCFTAQVEEDPVGSGLYQPRVPHHQEEQDGGS